ncbi:MAG: hypothetical protein JO190_03010 [Candidatus Eremiobacteraeota bacterium]|nr:hypothetical protein [Candidatus Eremiobacteraeota bacterium]
MNSAFAQDFGDVDSGYSARTEDVNAARVWGHLRDGSVLVGFKLVIRDVQIPRTRAFWMPACRHIAIARVEY